MMMTPHLHGHRLTAKIMGAVAALMLATACGTIEPEPLVDDEGEPIALPGPFDRWLTIVSVTPDDELSLRPIIDVTFSDYLDPATFTSYGLVTLNSGGIVAQGDGEYIMSTKTYRWRPRRALEPGFSYRLAILGADSLRSVTGAPFQAPRTAPRFVVDPDATVSAPEDTTATWDDVAEIFERRCWTCHSDPAWQLTPLNRDLGGQRSAQVNRYLVRAYDAPASYLMHKILPDYPLRRFTLQPPSWAAESEPLREKEILTIERWINAGAR